MCNQSARVWTPKGDSSSPRGDSSSPRGDSSSPRGDSSSPRANSSSPRADSSSPRADSSSPRGDSSSPRADSSSPRADSSSPRGDSSSPRTSRAEAMSLLPLTPGSSPSRGEGRFCVRVRSAPPLPLRERGQGGEGWRGSTTLPQPCHERVPKARSSDLHGTLSEDPGSLAILRQEAGPEISRKGAKSQSRKGKQANKAQGVRLPPTPDP